MSRITSIFICQSCGAQTRQFFGRCPSCGEWNSIIEELQTNKEVKSKKYSSNSSHQSSAKWSQPIDEIKQNSLNRLTTNYKEFDRTLGGGLVPGSLVLLGGEPGIGKSTLLLQSAESMAQKNTVLYVSAEESAQQIKLRWQRLEGNKSNLKILAATNLDIVLQELESLRPYIAIIDSIQALQNNNLSSAAGSVSQVKECSSSLQALAKELGIALIIVGHVTKEGSLAGPKVLEHLVDVVLSFEGERFASYRLLRAVKNRYGATHELGVFEMQAKGLIEVNNPSEIFLSGDIAPGVATIVAFEGSRALAIDLQALVNTTTYPTPRRTATGIETNRLHQILAVLEKHMHLNFSRHDCYLAVAGGLNVEEPAADLGIAAAVISSLKDLTVPRGTVLIGELGLGGQVRAVRQLPQRLLEAERLGFKRAIVPKNNGISPTEKEMKIQIVEVGNIQEVLTVFLGGQEQEIQKRESY